MNGNDSTKKSFIDSAERGARTHRRLWAAALTVGLATVSVIAYAAGGSGIARHHGAAMHGDGYTQINLTHLHAIVQHLSERATPEQKARIEALAAAAKPELISLDRQAADAHREMVDALLQDQLDPAAVAQAQAREIAANDLLAKRIDQALADLAGLMTPEQRAQLREHVRAHAG